MGFKTLSLLLVAAAPSWAGSPAQAPDHHAEPAQATAPASPAPPTPTPHSAEAPAAAHTQPEHPGLTEGFGGISKEELAGSLKIGQRKFEQGDLASAELAFTKVLMERASSEQDHDALIGLARTYRKKGDFTKATAVYEKFIKLYPNDVLLPTVYLELGRVLRNMGAYKQAIARFYSVINSTLKLPDDGSDSYRQLARTAQFEIAETYFVSGDYEQAGRFYARLRLLDLAPEDRARAHFKSAYSLVLDKKEDKAVVALNSFLDQYPGDDNAPEARYLLSTALYRMGRFQDSVAAAIQLLRAESSMMEKNPKRWAFWQRKTGNQLANDFYENGSFKSALHIYQSLEALSSEPLWKITVLYQIGLCHERMMQLDQARSAYTSILEQARDATLDANQTTEANDIVQMVNWRLKHIAWQSETNDTVSGIFSSANASSPPMSPTTTPAPSAPKIADTP